MSDDEIELVHRCAAGDDAAWRSLVNRFSSLAWSVVRRAGLLEHAAEDVVQEAFTAAWQALPKMREPDRFDAWLSTTCRRMAERRRMQDRRAAGSVPPDFIEPVSAHPEPAELAEGEEDRRLVRRALAELTQRCQTLLRALTELAPNSRREGRPNYEAVARLTGMPVGSIGPTRLRCLDALAGHLLRFGLHRARPLQRGE